MGFFIAAAAIAGTFFYFRYWKNKEHRKLLEDRDVKIGALGDVVKKLGLLILGSILVLVIVGAGVLGGWEFIQGSAIVGAISVVVGFILGVLCRQPEHEYNVFNKGYSALVEGNFKRSSAGDINDTEAA